MRRLAGACLTALLATACGDDVSSSDAEGGTQAGTTSTSSSAGDPSASETSSDASTGADGSSGDVADSSTTAAPPEALEFARYIRLDRLSANQATQVGLVDDGIEIPAEDYNTRIISGRRTLIRGFWSLHAEFEPREIVGRLTIDYPDGTQLEQDRVQFVEGESSDGAGASSFQWLLEPEQVVPGMRYRARLLEPDPQSDAAMGEVSSPPPIAPLAGPGTLALYDVPLELKVLLVPVRHEFEGCTSTPDITEQDVEDMRHELEQNNPVQRAEFSVREPMVYTETIGDAGGFSPLLAALAQARAEDDPEPNLYYYGLVDPCDGYPPGLLGQAIAIAGPPTMNNGQDRISTGRWNGSGAAAAETFVHEVGHTQGRRHVRCSGGEAGIDASYPHDGGRIGVWGFGIYDFELRSPSGGRDYMTYCSNEWVSDYGWEQTLDVIEVLTSFDAQDAPQRPDDVVLAGIEHEDGTATWWTQHSVVHPTQLGGARARFTLDSGLVDVPASVRPLPHSTRARYIEIPLRDDLRSARAVELDAGGHHSRIDLARVRTIR